MAGLPALLRLRGYCNRDWHTPSTSRILFLSAVGEVTENFRMVGFSKLRILAVFWPLFAIPLYRVALLCAYATTKGEGTG